MIFDFYSYSEIVIGRSASHGVDVDTIKLKILRK